MTNTHNHSGKNHLLGMLGAAAVVIVVLLAAGRSFGEAWPLAAVLACPLMMIGMMFMMGKNDRTERSHGRPHPVDEPDVSTPSAHHVTTTRAPAQSPQPSR
ncbi:DUF2933 domain-containing protein [Georgenia daeguensis]|uniref:DUF2933 domain-containing protein n=1 Tax=Georgenia daeguensis TaxID=908355 RepID=A0ABP6UP74_9MICO